jgi:hypothetical protein
MVKNILPGSVSTGDSMSPLIPFDMIVDTDVGLLSLIFKSYMDPKIFNKSFFVGKTVNELVYVSTTIIQILVTVYIMSLWKQSIQRY